MWNIARHVDALCNELGITIPVAIHADHFGIKSVDDIPQAKIEIPSLFDAGITSIAIDASHMPDAQNLLANLELKPFVPDWAGNRVAVAQPARRGSGRVFSPNGASRTGAASPRGARRTGHVVHV